MRLGYELRELLAAARRVSRDTLLSRIVRSLPAPLRYSVMKCVITTWLSAAILIITSWAHALERCDISSKTGDICLCRLSELHPTQAAVGMMEVRIRAEKLRQKMQGRSEEDFLEYLEKHDRVEPVVVGPSGILY